MSGPPVRLTGRRTRERQEANSAGQAPLHRLDAAGIAAGADEAEIGPRLLQRVHVEVSLLGRLLDVGDWLRTAGELLAEEALRALAALGLFCQHRVFP